jgi:hypothetical protein
VTANDEHRPCPTTNYVQPILGPLPAWNSSFPISFPNAGYNEQSLAFFNSLACSLPATFSFVCTGPFSFCLAWKTTPGFTALVLEHHASYLKSTSSSCLRFMLFACGLTTLKSTRLLYLLYKFQQHIIMLVFFFVLV